MWWWNLFAFTQQKCPFLSLFKRAAGKLLHQNGPVRRRRPTLWAAFVSTRWKPFFYETYQSLLRLLTCSRIKVSAEARIQDKLTDSKPRKLEPHGGARGKDITKYTRFYHLQDMNVYVLERKIDNLSMASIPGPRGPEHAEWPIANAPECWFQSIDSCVVQFLPVAGTRKIN